MVNKKENKEILYNISIYRRYRNLYVDFFIEGYPTGSAKVLMANEAKKILRGLWNIEKRTDKLKAYFERDGLDLRN